MAGAALACAWISLPNLAFPLVALGIVLAWGWHLAHALQLGRSAVHALEFNTSGGVRWQDGSGQWQEGSILPGSYISGWLIVVILGGEGRRGRSLALMPDAAAAEELRQLRTWLRWRLARP
jgi:hypothetical protein